MNFDKITQKCGETIRGAQEIAKRESNSSIECAHILLALLSDSEGLFPELCAKAGADVGILKERATEITKALPKVYGEGAVVYL